MLANENKTKRYSAAYGDYSSIANCRTEIPVILLGKFGIILYYITVFICSTISLGIPSRVLGKHDWKTPLYIKSTDGTAWLKSCERKKYQTSLRQGT
jgi:hypothetical protein